ncbi:hypothetical protein F4819DRAFT_341060 [Hypoxylon fuscum]|nr:hypothetical protein F4819DRAFT_341060 [Hypoxylon fuscum]
MIFSDGCGNSTTVTGVVMYDIRREERKQGNAILNWQRPTQTKLGNGNRVLANGQFVGSSECTGSDGSNSL